jgi:hypothetical protein
MGYSSAAVTMRSLLFASLGPGALRNLIRRPVRGAFNRLGAVDVFNRLKPVKSTVNVKVAPAQRALGIDMVLLDSPIATGVPEPAPGETITALEAAVLLTISGTATSRTQAPKRRYQRRLCTLCTIKHENRGDHHGCPDRPPDRRTGS